MIFIENDLVTKRVKELESDSIEIICLELTIPRKKWVIFFFYRPPKSKMKIFFDELNTCIDKATQKYENLVLMGDINIDTLDEGATGWDKLTEFCDIFELENLRKSTTCETIKSSSSIDIILTNKKRCFIDSSTIETGISDVHKMVNTTMRALKPIKIQYRSCKIFKAVSHDPFSRIRFY